MIIARLVKILLVVSVILCVILACSDLEIGNPGEFTINVSLFAA
jgi:hypothetical protein